MPEESKLVEKLENQTKFSEEELEQIQNIRTSYINIQNAFGQISITKIRLHDQLEMLDKNYEENIQQFKKTQETENKLLEEITKKYGEGSLNPETGEFTPNKS